MMNEFPQDISLSSSRLVIQFLSIHVNAKGEKSLVKDRYMIYCMSHVPIIYLSNLKFCEREAASRLYDGALVASLFVWSVLRRADTLHLCEREQWLEHAAGTRCCATPPSNKSWGRLCRGGGQWFLGKTCNHRPVCPLATHYHVQVASSIICTRSMHALKCKWQMSQNYRFKSCRVEESCRPSGASVICMIDVKSWLKFPKGWSFTWCGSFTFHTWMDKLQTWMDRENVAKQKTSSNPVLCQLILVWYPVSHKNSIVSHWQ